MIEPSDTLMSAIIKLCDGNPGAAIVCASVVKHSEFGMMDLLHMDDMGLKGSAIWVGYKYYCGEDIAKFVEAVRSRDLEMINKIRAEGYAAARHGASFA